MKTKQKISNYQAIVIYDKYDTSSKQKVVISDKDIQSNNIDIWAKTCSKKKSNHPSTLLIF